MGRLSFTFAALLTTALITRLRPRRRDRHGITHGHRPDRQLPADRSPCGIADALEPASTPNGDNVILARTGTYPVGAPLHIADGVHVYGAVFPQTRELRRRVLHDNVLHVDRAGGGLSEGNVEFGSVFAAPLMALTGKVDARDGCRNAGGDACSAYGPTIIPTVCWSTARRARAWSSPSVPELPDQPAKRDPDEWPRRVPASCVCWSAASPGDIVIAIGMIAAGAAGAVFLEQHKPRVSPLPARTSSLSLQGASTIFQHRLEQEPDEHAVAEVR